MPVEVPVAASQSPISLGGAGGGASKVLNPDIAVIGDFLGAERGGVVVGDGDPHELGRSAEALQMLDAAHGLEYRVIARPIAVGAVGTEGGDGAVDQARIQRAQRC